MQLKCQETSLSKACRVLGDLVALILGVGIMQLVYLAHARLPTEKAHGYQIVKMCAAFAQNGVVGIFAASIVIDSETI